jgi:putative oxidoreductase
MSPKSRALRIGLEVLLWAVCLRLVLVFAGAGWHKFDPTGGWAKAFTYWGYPPWFRILIGVLEIGAALLLLWPRAAAYGATIIIVVMLGGMGTHVFVEHRPSRITSELVHLVFASIALAGRWQARIRRLTR